MLYYMYSVFFVYFDMMDKWCYDRLWNSFDAYLKKKWYRFTDSKHSDSLQSCLVANSYTELKKLEDYFRTINSHFVVRATEVIPWYPEKKCGIASRILLHTLYGLWYASALYAAHYYDTRYHSEDHAYVLIPVARVVDKSIDPYVLLIDPTYQQMLFNEPNKDIGVNLYSGTWFHYAWNYSDEMKNLYPVVLDTKQDLQNKEFWDKSVRYNYADYGYVIEPLQKQCEQRLCNLLSSDHR